MFVRSNADEEATMYMSQSVTVKSKQQSIMRAVCGTCGKDTETHLLLKNIERGGGTYDVYYCTHCHTGITVPFPSHEALSRLYSSGSYRSNDGTRFNVFAESLVRYFNIGGKKKIKRFHREKGAILDVGCGRGLFLDIMKKDGWSVTGIEFNEETASYATTVYGINVITAPAMANLPDGYFDVITLSHVLEHMRDPAAVLRECRRLLKERALLVIAMPNFASLQASFGKSNWFHLDIPYHLYHITFRGIKSLLLDNSMKIAKVRQFDFGQNVFGWLQTLLNMSGIKNNLMYNLLKKPELRQGELAAARKRDLLFTLLLTPIYLPLSAILSILESLILRRGGTIHIYAIKQ